MGLTLFRSHQFKKQSHDNFNQNIGKRNETEGRNEGRQSRLFTIQEAVSKFDRRTEENQETLPENVEDDIVIEDIETPPSSGQVSIGVMIHETYLDNTLTENQLSNCLPGIGLKIQALNKYFKNTLMSLLIMSYLFPWNLSFLYRSITKSGCENPTYNFIIQIGEYYYILMFCIFLPFLIKLKLDRLSN